MRMAVAAATVLAAGLAGSCAQQQAADIPERAIDVPCDLALTTYNHGLGDVTDAFIRWNAAVAAGNSSAAFDGLTAGMKASWLWARLQDPNDGTARTQLDRLDSASTETLDEWRSRAQLRRTPLPESLATSSWLRELYRDWFARTPTLVAEAKTRRIVEAYLGGDGGATLLTDNAGAHELFGMTREAGSWRIDNHRPARRR